MREIIIEGYTLLYVGDSYYTYNWEGMPLCACREAEGSYNYTLEIGAGMPYIVNLHALRYYLSYRNIKRDSYPNYAPRDYRKLSTSSTPYHICISMGRGFSLKVDTYPLNKAIEPYKVLPKDCLIDTKSYKAHSDNLIVCLLYTSDAADE